jgi:hypothetical protein
MMPIGFARPRGLLPVGIDYTYAAYENTPQLRQDLDPRGLPRMWLPDQFADDPIGCPCRGMDGIARCRQCRAEARQSI